MKRIKDSSKVQVHGIPYTGTVIESKYFGVADGLKYLIRFENTSDRFLFDGSDEAWISSSEVQELIVNE